LNAFLQLIRQKLNLADKIDLEGASDELQAQFLPIIVKNKVLLKCKYCSLAAFYPFIKFQNPELGKRQKKVITGS
jgi:aminopeptidase N